MKLDTNALLKAGGIGAAAALVLTLAALLPFVGIVCCCLLYVAYAGVGVLYPFFAQKNGTAISAGPGALGGAIAAAIAGVVQGIVSGVATMITAGAGGFMASAAQLESMGIEVPPDVYNFYSSAASGVVVALTGLCIALVLSVILGAIGGAVYGGMRQSPAAPSAPAM
jgi:hypothetical protein